jgi:hypothetical protein
MEETDYSGVWPAQIKSWTLDHVEEYDAWVLKIWMAVKGEGWTKAMQWSGWMEKKDGGPNRNTFKTLALCGFESDNFAELANDDALDTETWFNVTVEADGKYWNIKWINTQDFDTGAVAGAKVLKGADLTKLNSYLGPAKPKLKNHAPPSLDTSDIDEFLN